jgi:hypothetical protein
MPQKSLSMQENTSSFKTAIVICNSVRIGYRNDFFVERDIRRKSVSAIIDTEDCLNRFYTIWICFLLVWLSCVPATIAAPLKPSRAGWKGTSAGFDISFTPARFLITSRGGRAVFDSTRIFAFCRKKERFLPDCPAGIHLEQRYKLLSVVGPYVCFEYDFYIGCLNYVNGGIQEVGAHPAMGRVFYALDCRNPGNIASHIAEPGLRNSAAPCRLDQIFPAAELRKALTESFEFDAEKTRKMNFKQFKDYVAEKCCDYVDPCTDFAFSKVANGCVFVNVGVGGGGFEHGLLKETPLNLKIPPKYKKDFERASSGKVGFLESNRPAVVRSLTAERVCER